MKQYKTCRGCRALDAPICCLGHKVHVEYDRLNVPKVATPKERCPKPLTIKDFQDILRSRTKTTKP